MKIQWRLSQYLSRSQVLLKVDHFISCTLRCGGVAHMPAVR
jgi:hypothetical protein